MFTPLRVVIVIAVTFGFLFVIENNRSDANDYDTNIVNALRKEGYDVVVEDLGEKTELPKQIHIHQEPHVDLEMDPGKSTNVYHKTPKGKPWPSPMEMFGETAVLKLVPLFGEIRPEKDAVFTFAKGVPFNNLVRFVGSLQETGFDGDIVMAVEQRHELDKDTLQYLEYHSKHSHLVVYQAELVCKKIKMKTRCKVFKMFAHKTLGGYLPDLRPHRELAQLRFEYYWAWSTQYSPKSRLFLLDSGDLMFQENPFPYLPVNMEKTIVAFEESNLKNIGDESNNRLWLREGHERKYLHSMGKNNVLCAGTVAGGQAAVETFCRAMVNQWDTTKCTIIGCDQGHFNFLVHGNFLVGSPGIEKVDVVPFDESFVISLAIQVAYSHSLRHARIVQGGSNYVLNKKGKPAAIAHQFDKDPELKQIYDTKKTAPYLEAWAAIKKTLTAG